MDIQHVLNQVYTLTEPAMEKMMKVISELEYPKGCQLISADKIERNIYIIKHGIARAYTYSEKDEVTFWIGQEGDILMSIKSYVNNQKGYESIELLEDSVVYKLNTEALNKLFLTDVEIANWGRKFAEHELLKAERRFIAMQSCTASERYAALIAESPELLQRVPLSYIASYLGVTQVSLSRIRAKYR